MTWSGASSGEHFVASNPAFPGLPQTNKAAGMLARNWPLAAGIPQLMAGGTETLITIAPTGIPASVAANTTVNIALTGITGLAATDILVGVQKAATQAGLMILPADLSQGGVTGVGAATVRYVNDTVGAIVPTAAEAYTFRILRNNVNLPTLSLSAANAATAVAGGLLRALVTPVGGPSATYVPGLVTISGAPPVVINQFAVETSWIGEGGTWQRVDFVTDSPKFEAVFVGFGQQVKVWVNGQVMSSLAGAPTAGTSTFVPGGIIPSDGNTYRLLLDFAGVRTFRHIGIEVVTTALRLQGLQMVVTDTLIPGPRKGARVILVDDSMSESTGATDGTSGLTQILSQLTGWDIWPCSYGTTGWVAAGTRTKAFDHIHDILDNAPDLVIWFLGINDYGQNGGASVPANKAAIKAQALLCFQTVQTSLPNVPQIALGPEAPTGNVYLNADWMACRDAIKEAAAAANIPFADPIGLGYLKGTGKVGATTGDGGADFLVSNDSTHPSQAGHTAYAWAVASVIAAAING